MTLIEITGRVAGCIVGAKAMKIASHTGLRYNEVIIVGAVTSCATSIVVEKGCEKIIKKMKELNLQKNKIIDMNPIIDTPTNFDECSIEECIDNLTPIQIMELVKEIHKVAKDLNFPDYYYNQKSNVNRLQQVVNNATESGKYSNHKIIEWNLCLIWMKIHKKNNLYDIIGDNTKNNIDN